MKTYQFKPPKKVRVFPVVGRFLGIGRSDEVEAPTALVLHRYEREGYAGSVDYFQIAIPMNATAALIHYSVVEEDPGKPREHRTYIVRTADRTWQIRIITLMNEGTTWVWVDEEPQTQATD